MRRVPILPSCVAAALAAAGPTAAAPQDPRPVLVEAARVLLAPGEMLEGADARLLLRDGKVAGVGRSIPAEAAARARRVALAGATLAPGLVSLHDQLDRAADLAETIEPFTPELRAADAFDPFAKALAAAARTGLTTVLLAPSSANVCGGIACAVKPGRETGGRLATADGYLKLALVDEALTDDRYPTSRMGAADLIRASFAAARAPLGAGGPALEVLRAAEAGAVPVAIHARTQAEIGTALDLATEFGLAPVLLDAVDLDEATIERLRGGRVAVALAALDYDATDERLGLPARLAAAQIRFAFVGPDGAALRRSAALALRHGLDRRTAQAAITEVPAQLAGLGERAGTLRVGRDADFLVLSGDPVDLSSRLLQVWVDGSPVLDAAAPHAGQPQETR